MRPSMKRNLLCSPLLTFALVACGASSDGERGETSSGEQTPFEERRVTIEASVDRELSQLETAIADLRAQADATTENFTSELVHVDELMSELRARLETARVETEEDLEELRADTRAQIDEIQEAVSNLENRIAAAEEADEPT